jgi:ABC-type multidrug transport system fused ATPase/permease subunit
LTLDKNSVRDNISYVNQGAGIFNTTIKENIIYGLEYDKERYQKAIELAHCEFIKDLPKKDDYIVGENGKKLSGGQRQRLALARAIYKDGSLFVLDEATSALDADTENMIQSSLEEIMKQKTTIVIAHRLNTIKNADKVIVLSEGKIVEIGSYEDVSKTEAFKKNFALKEKRV